MSASHHLHRIHRVWSGQRLMFDAECSCGDRSGRSRLRSSAVHTLADAHTRRHEPFVGVEP